MQSGEDRRTLQKRYAQPARVTAQKPLSKRAAALRKKKNGPEDKESTNSFNLGDRLRSLRSERGISLDALAAQAGVTKGFLSLVERGVKAPSISTLLRLSKTYRLSVGALLDEPKPAEPAYSLVRRNERKKYAREGSLYGYRYEALAFHKKLKRMEPFIVSPPCRAPRKFFQHDGDEMVYVLKGHVEIQLGPETIRLIPGDCLYFDATTPHRSRSTGRGRALTLVVVSAAT